MVLAAIGWVAPAGSLADDRLLVWTAITATVVVAAVACFPVHVIRRIRSGRGRKPLWVRVPWILFGVAIAPLAG